MKRGQIIFAAVFCVMVVVALGSVLVYGACDEGSMDSPFLYQLSKKMMAVFSFPSVIIAQWFHAARIGYLLFFYLLDVFIYSCFVSYALNKWVKKKGITLFSV